MTHTNGPESLPDSTPDTKTRLKQLQNSIVEITDDKPQNTLVEVEAKQDKPIQKEQIKSYAEIVNTLSVDATEALTYHGAVTLDRSKLVKLLAVGLGGERAKQVMSYYGQVEQAVNTLAKEMNISPFALLSVIYSESKFDLRMMNPHSKAIGLIQFYGAKKAELMSKFGGLSLSAQIAGMRAYFLDKHGTAKDVRSPWDLKMYVLVGQNTKFASHKQKYANHPDYINKHRIFQQNWDLLKKCL